MEGFILKIFPSREGLLTRERNQNEFRVKLDIPFLDGHLHV